MYIVDLTMSISKKECYQEYNLSIFFNILMKIKIKDSLTLNLFFSPFLLSIY